MSSKIMLLAAATLLLCGCRTAYTPHIGDEDPALGETVKYNAAAQIIYPDPVYSPEGAQPGDSGAKAQAAMKRYRTDAVKPLQTLQTSSTGNSSGGSGTSGSASGPSN